MYLADRDITTLLPSLGFHTDEDANPFDPELQVQPCSIDLRLGRVFWRPTGRRTIDLRRSQFLEVSPRSAWTKRVLSDGEGLDLEPGGMVLARTLEAFAMPDNHAGMISGRSSFARLGLSVHCNAELINPGWRGRVPLQLVNLSKTSIHLAPLVPICQVVLIPLSSSAERPYGQRALSSKYMDDDGGPSFWWRDMRIERLHKSLAVYSVSLKVQDEILHFLHDQDPEILGRLEQWILQLPQQKVTNATDLLDDFAISEDRLRFVRRILRDGRIGTAPLLIACSLGSIYSQPFGLTTYGWLHYALWALTVLAIPFSAWGLRDELGAYLTTHVLQSIRRNTVSESSRERKPIKARSRTRAQDE